MKASLRHTKGFTLIEITLSVALILALGAATMGVYHSVQSSSNLKIVSYAFAEAARRAQLLARTKVQDSAWSIEVEDDAITLYKGTDFGARDTTYDEVHDIPTSINVYAEGTYGATTVVRTYNFSAYDGLPNTTGSVIFATQGDEVTRTISINEYGTISQ